MDQEYYSSSLVRISKGTWRRAFMNLRCAICCLTWNRRRSVMDRSVRSLYGGTSTPAIYLSLLRALLRCLFLCRFSFLASSSPVLLPRPVNLDPGSTAKEGRAGGEAKGCKRGKGKRRLKYHEDIIRYCRVVYPYRHPPYDRIKQLSILIHDDNARQRDTTRPSRPAESRIASRDSQDRTLIG